MILAFFAARLPGPLPLYVYGGFCAANVIEVLISALVVRKFVPIPSFEKRADVLSVTMGASIVASLVSAVIGGAVVSLAIGKATFWSSSIGWFTSDLSGLLLVLPALLVWLPAGAPSLRSYSKAKLAERIIVVVLVVVIGIGASVYLTQERQLSTAFPYLVFPILIWIALRFGTRSTTAAVLVVGLFTIMLTFLGRGPFVIEGLSAFGEVVFMNVGLITIALTSVLLSVVVLSRTEAEKALQQSEESFRTLFSSSPVAMNIMRVEDGRIVDANGAWLAIFGHPREEAIGRTDLELGNWPASNRRAELIELVRRDGGFRNEEVVHRKRDGTEIDVLASVQKIELSEKSSVITTLVDISARKRIEQELVDERQRLAEVIWGTNVGTWEWNIQSGAVRCNERWAEIVGYTLDELTPISIDTWMRLAHPDDLKRSGILLEKTFAGELNFYECEARMRHKDGSWVWVLDRGKVIEWAEDGKPLRMAGTHQDITTRKKMEDHLRHAQKMEVVGQLAGGTAHEFNNLLQVIQANLDLARQKNDGNEKTLPFLESSAMAVKRGAKLTEQLLAFSRQQTLRPEGADPNALTEGAAALLGRILGGNIEITTVFAADCPLISIDPNRFANALINVALNARAAMPMGGKLTIRTDVRQIENGEIVTEEGVLPAGNYVEVAVADTGCGMPPEVLGRAFEPFFTTREVGQGSGLGLSMVYGFVRQSGGHVALESEVGKGATVRMMFPAVELKADTALEAREETTMEAGVGTILVVEDDPDVRRNVALVFEMLGYAVWEAKSGLVALEILDEEAGIDLLFTDVLMPGGMSGVDLAREAVRRHRTLKVLLTSGYPEKALKEVGLVGGNFPLLGKPYSSVDLREALRSIFSR